MKESIVIRKYSTRDHLACVEIFKSNLPRFFDQSEFKFFEIWLTAQDKGQIAYANSDADHYYVLEFEGKVIACGGFFVVKDKKETSMAWGMLDSKYHKKGYGKKLFEFRIEEIKKIYPGYAVGLHTSQHTYGFFEKLGFTVTKITPQGYSPDLDRYDMVKK